MASARLQGGGVPCCIDLLPLSVSFPSFFSVDRVCLTRRGWSVVGSSNNVCRGNTADLSCFCQAADRGSPCIYLFLEYQLGSPHVRRRKRGQCLAVHYQGLPEGNGSGDHHDRSAGSMHSMPRTRYMFGTGAACAGAVRDFCGPVDQAEGVV